MEHPNPNPPESAPVGHEIRDAAPRPILIFAVCLVATLVLVHLVGWGALRFLQHAPGYGEPSRISESSVIAGDDAGIRRSRVWNRSHRTMCFRMSIWPKCRRGSRH